MFILLLLFGFVVIVDATGGPQPNGDLSIAQYFGAGALTGIKPSYTVEYHVCMDVYIYTCVCLCAYVYVQVLWLHSSKVQSIFSKLNYKQLFSKPILNIRLLSALFHILLNIMALLDGFKVSITMLLFVCTCTQCI